VIEAVVSDFIKNERRIDTTKIARLETVVMRVFKESMAYNSKVVR